MSDKGSDKGYPIDPMQQRASPAPKFKKPPTDGGYDTMPRGGGGLANGYAPSSAYTTSAYGTTGYAASDEDSLPPLLSQYTSQYRKYIDLIDQLRGFGLERELPLPRVAVIGVQSCGKSSVLEGISGLCLPRGTGTVTRCPVELQMKHNPDPLSDWEGRLFCQNGRGQAMNRTLRSPQEVANIVDEAQNFLAGRADLSTLPITIEINSHTVPDLTLIDLPGLIENTMPNQPDDLPEKIHSLITEYIAPKETLIMVVVACNSEIATTKALKLANQVDPHGVRTLGVLTKPDLVDPGTEQEILNMVANPSRYRVRKGFTVVKMRGQAAIDANTPLNDSLQEEAQFFDTHMVYKRVPKANRTVQSLATTLTTELVQRIKEVLPSLKEETHVKLKENEVALSRLGNNIPKELRERQHFLTDTLNQYVNKVCRICDGIIDHDVPTELRLLYWTRPVIEEFAMTVEQMCPSGDDRALMERIAKEIREQRGMELPGFLPFKACQVIIYNLLREFKLPAKTCLYKINACVETFLSKMAEEKFGTFPNLEREIKLVAANLQSRAFKKCDESIDESFEMEYLVVIPDILFHKGQYGAQHSYYDVKNGPKVDKRNAQVLDVDTNGEPIFEVSRDTVDDATKQMQEEQGRSRGAFGRRKPPKVPPPSRGELPPPPPETIPNEHESSEATNFTYEKIAIYFRSALDRLMGTVPMRVHWFLIKKLSDQIQSEVIALATDPNTIELLAEDEKTAAVRQDLEDKIERLNAAHQELTKI